MSGVAGCPFCELLKRDPTGRILARNEHAFLVADGFPVSDGHSLVISKRHVSSFFDASEAEKLAIMELIEEAKARVEQNQSPAGYNIGINDGPAAGQTVPHLHVHLIPRYPDEPGDPRGGIRWVVPEKADYWSE